MARSDQASMGARDDVVARVAGGCLIADIAARRFDADYRSQPHPDHRLRKFSPRTVIFSQGDAASHVYRVKTGAVMVYRLLADGRRQIVNLAQEGDFVGISDISLYESSAESIQDVELVEYEPHVFKSSPELMQEMLEFLKRQVRNSEDMSLTLGRKSATERVATFLLRHIPKRGRADCPGPLANRPDQANFDIVMTRQEIADYLGLTIETVSRSFSDLRRRGAIVLNGKDYVSVVNICALCHIAESK